jgi:hypothetical protein
MGQIWYLLSAPVVKVDEQMSISKPHGLRMVLPFAGADLRNRPMGHRELQIPFEVKKGLGSSLDSCPRGNGRASRARGGRTMALGSDYRCGS